MKKIAMFFAAAAIALSASAQKSTITSNKAGDNIYMGINGGAITPARGAYSFNSYDPALGIRVGKNFSTVFGLAVDASALFSSHVKNCKDNLHNGTIVQGLEIDLLGTANLMNLVGGYKGEPRCFEIIALGGFGWMHSFPHDGNGINSKVAVDLAYNFGSQKQWQVYLEPSLTYELQAFNSVKVMNQTMEAKGMKYNLNNAIFALKAGINYKLTGSNGKRNYSIEQLRDQSEIDGLNATINSLRSNLDGENAANARRDAKIAELQKALTECQNKPVPVVVEDKSAANLQPSVVFNQGKSVVEKSQMANISMIATYMKKHEDAKIKVSGYASPEGSAELNQKLSVARAEAVKTILVKKYKIAADRIETEGLGATDKLFDQVEFNRVALFNDTTK